MQFVLRSILREKSMYRQQLARDEMAAENEQFLTCVSTLPVVNSTWTQVSSMYQKTKEYNALLRYTLDMAENSVKTVVSTAQPIVHKYDGPIQYMNSVACNQLNQLKESYPVIAKPTDEVIQAGKDKCSALLKPAVDTVTAVKDFGVNTYTKSTGRVSSMAHSATDFSKSQLTKASQYGQDMVSQALQTGYGQVVNDKVNNILDTSELYMDKYLPLDDTEPKEPALKTKNALARAGHVSTKLRRRMYTRAMKDLHNVKIRSTETLSKLNFTVDLIQYARNNLDGAKTMVGETFVAAQTKIWDTWSEINKEELENEDGKEGLDNNSLERRGIAVARQLTLHLKRILASMQSSASGLPLNLQEKYKGLQDYTDDLYKSFKLISGMNEVPGWMLNQTKNQLGYVQEMMSFLTDQALASWPLSLLVMEVNLEGLQLEEIEHMWNCNGQIHNLDNHNHGNQAGNHSDEE